MIYFWIYIFILHILVTDLFILLLVINPFILRLCQFLNVRRNIKFTSARSKSMQALTMTSIAPSDSESNVSGFIRYSDKNVKHLYTSMLENMETINQDILKVEKNVKNLIHQAGPLEGQLSALLQSLPKPNITLPMDTD